MMDLRGVCDRLQQGLPESDQRRSYHAITSTENAEYTQHRKPERRGSHNDCAPPKEPTAYNGNKDLDDEQLWYSDVAPSSRESSSATASPDSRTWILPQEHNILPDGEMEDDVQYQSLIVGLQEIPISNNSLENHDKDSNEDLSPATISSAELSYSASQELFRPGTNALQSTECQSIGENSRYQAPTALSSLYQPLPTARSCRVLHILPGEENDNIVCNLNVMDLGERHPNFEALSYVWGSRESPAEILCNSRIISVTRNLRDGLRRIRYRHQTRTVWVDAICINQSDDVERGEQVRLMGLIYHDADHVLVWLGHLHSEYAESAFSTLRNIHRDRRVFRPPSTSSYSDDFSNLRIDWEPLRKFYQLEYFKRIWVLQEVVEASSAHFIWGERDITWKIIGEATYFIRHEKNALSHLYDDQSAGLFHAYIMYRIPHAEFQPVTFFDLLRLTSQFSATDERDKIFAILGLPNQDADPKKGDLFIDPDYTLSRESVYRKVALKIFETSPMPFDLLSAVDHQDCICDDYPSWIPQWHINNTLDLVALRQEAKYKPSGGHWAKGMGSDNRTWITDHNLFAFGFQYDTITHSTETLEARGNHNAWYHNQLCSWLENIPIRANGERHSWQSIAWTLLTGKDWYGIPITDLEGVWDADGPSESALSAAWGYCRNRKVFITTNGTLGLGPSALAAGDIVCVLFGATIPFVLRPKNESYRLAGSCYVHEVMAGELVDEWRQDKRTVESFHIQ